MATNLKEKKIEQLFPDYREPCNGKKLFVNKYKIVEVLQQLKTEESLSGLRNGVVRIESNLRSVKSDKIGLLNIDRNGDTIEIPQKHLFEQLDQVVESQTLERGKYYVDRIEKAITEVRTSKFNNINLNRWKEYEDIITDNL